MLSNPTTVLGALERVRDLIAEPCNWTQNELARDCNGTPVADYDAGAVAWCLDGAVLRAIEDADDTFPLYRDVGRALDAVAAGRRLPTKLPSGRTSEAGNYIQYNDGADHAAVLSLVDEAIATEREKAGSQPVPA